MQRGRELMPSDLPLIEKSALEHLLQVQVLKLAATDADNARAKEIADKRLELIKKRSTSEEALAKQLKTLNLTLDDLRSRLLEEAVFQEVLRDRIKLTDDQVKKYFDDNPAQFEEPEMVRASHILIATVDPAGTPMTIEEKKAKKKMAEDLLKRAQGGEDFTKLAKEYSDDPSAKETGGEFTLPRARMPVEFAAAAFSLKTNQVSDLVVIEDGYHIIKLSEKIPAKKMEFAKISPQLKEYLEAQEMEKILPETYAKLKKDSNVQILDDQLRMLEEAHVAMPVAPAPAPAAPPVAPAPK
jgi:parvulin-like peptidyl-prolyl isomerase